MLANVMWVGRVHPGARLFMALLPLALLVLLVVAIVFIVRLAGRHQSPAVPPPPGAHVGWPSPTPPTSNPLQVLDERLARGEIDEADYQSRRALLLQNQSS